MRIKTFLNLTLLLSLLSCNKESEQDLISRMNNNIAGNYKYESISWSGPAIDFNGDGKADTDMIKEYAGMDNCENLLKSKNSGVVARLYKLNSATSIFISVPMQILYYEKDTEQYRSGSGGLGGVEQTSVQYLLYKSGDISFDYSDSFKTKDSDDRVDLVKGGKILSLADGVMKFTAECSFYDHLTKSVVSGTLEAKMIRAEK